MFTTIHDPLRCIVCQFFCAVRVNVLRWLVLVIILLIDSHAVFALPPAVGDLDQDGQITVLDLVRLINHVQGTAPLSADLLPFADINGDGYVDQNDEDALAKLILGQSPPAQAVSLEPAAGAVEVGVTVRPKVTFPRPINIATLNSNNFFASFAGQKLTATIVPGSNGTFAWLFFNGSMPASSQIQITVDGSTITNLLGQPLDADGDGVPGGKMNFSFSTVSVTPIPGTVVSSRIVDPGPDLIPRTSDDVRLGNGGYTYLLPIAGVKVYVLGLESNFTFTDTNGQFTLTNMPVGDAKVVMDGRTATSPPNGYYFPEMVMDTTFSPGVTNGVMSIRDTNGVVVRDANGMPIRALAMYLPRVASNILQTVDATKVTTIGLNSNDAYNLPLSQQQYLTVQLQPGSLIGPDGQPMSSAQVGVSVVPPGLVSDMLPPGLAQHTFDITVQAMGVAAFSTPAQMSFPNVFNAAPGTQLNFLSFDHTTGRLVIEGTATVSADGLYVTTDPGTGVTHPGWHGLLPPGVKIDPRTGRPCVASAGALQMDGLKDLQKSIFGAFTTSAELGEKGAELLSEHAAETLFKAVARVGIFKDFLDCYNEHDVTACASAAVTLVSFATPAGDIRLVEAAVSVGIGVYGAYENYSKYQEAFESLANLPPCPQSAGGSTTPISPIQFGPALAGDLNQIAQDVPEQVPEMDNMINDANTINDIGQNINTNAPNLGLTPAQMTQFVNAAQDYVNNAQQIDQQGSVLNPIFDLAQNVGPFVGEYTTPISTAPVTPGVVTQLPAFPGEKLFWSAEYNGTVLRGTATAGTPISFFGPADTIVRVQVFDSLTKEIGLVVFFTGKSGSPVIVPAVPLFPDTSVDTDGDGLSDQAEFVIGTDPTKWSTAGDGISDGAKVAQGLDPLAGSSFVTGVVAALPIPGQANEVVLVGSKTNPGQQTAYVAGGTRGLSIVDASQFRSPILLGQLDLPGQAVDVSVDSGLQIAVVAARGGGLHFVDVSKPAQPVLMRTANISPSRVAVVQGVAYAAVGSTILSYDVQTGNALQGLALPGGAGVTGLSSEGFFLYSMDAARQLRVIDISNPLGMVLRGSLVLPSGAGKVFVGGGIVYALATSFSQGGYVTVNVQNPDLPVLLSGSDVPPTTSEAGTAFAANGSGLGILVGGTLARVNAVDVMNSSDPMNTFNYITRYTVPAPPMGVAIGSGIAFVADGSAGLQVINYRPFDNQGVPPTINLSNSFQMLTPTTARVEGGKSVLVSALTADDVQVHDVQFFINGVAQLTDVSFPFEYRFVTPLLSSSTTNFTLQAKAMDTGGNVGWSPLINVAVVLDATPPQVVGHSPEGSLPTVNSIVVQFSEPMAPSSFSSNSVMLISAGPDGILGTGDDQVVGNGAITYASDSQTVRLSFAGNLPFGLYQARVNTEPTDLSGNHLSSGTAWQFTVAPCQTAPAGIVNWWPGNGDATDIAGGLNGTLLNGVTFAPGMVGQAFSFNGTGAEVDSGTTMVLNSLPLTIEAWVNPALRSESGFFPNNAVSNDQPGASGHGFGVNVTAVGSQFTVEYEDGFRTVPGVNFSAGQWYHIAVVYMPGEVKSYVNGQLVDDFTFTQGPLDGATFVRIGKHNDDAATYGTRRFFAGLIDEVSIYNRDLGANEIAAVYTAGAAGKCQDLPPAALGVGPTNDSILATATTVTVSFNRGIDPSTLTSSSFTLTWAGPDSILGTADDAVITSGLFTFDAASLTASLTVSNGLAPGLYRVVLNGGITDLSGLSLQNPMAWTFWVLPGGPNGDADGDGLSNQQEIQIGTNPLSIDTDGDGWSDDAELLVGSNPLDARSTPKLLITAKPGVLVALPAVSVSGGQPLGTVVAGPPVAISLTSLAGSAFPLSTTLAQPPVMINLPALSGPGGVPLNTVVAEPPVSIQLPSP